MLESQETFDDAQTGVKKMFNDKNMAEELSNAGYQFSSANSINIGRLVPQIVYYVYAYATLYKNGEIKAGEKINAKRAKNRKITRGKKVNSVHVGHPDDSERMIWRHRL